MSSPPSEPIFENQLGYERYREEQGLRPLTRLDLHGKVVPYSEEERDAKDDSETEDECKLYVNAVILFKYSHLYQPTMKMNLILNRKEVRTRACND